MRQSATQKGRQNARDHRFILWDFHARLRHEEKLTTHQRTLSLAGLKDEMVCDSGIDRATGWGRPPSFTCMARQDIDGFIGRLF